MFMLFVKMDDDYTLSCPLCCGKTFNTKETLVEHLSNYTTNYGCPICNYKFSSVSLLVEHLSNTNCKSHEMTSAEKVLHEQNLLQKKYSAESPKLKPKIETVSKEENINNEDVNEDFHDASADDHDMLELPEESLDAHKIYDELLLQKTLEKPCFPGTDLQLLEENGHSKYTIVEHNGTPAIMTSNGNIITKQNSDGTISITTIKNIEEPNLSIDPEPVITVKDSESDGKEEMFSCNTCGVSFSSVIEHIQNYHKDQDVVVEMNECQGTEEGSSSTLEFCHDDSTEKEHSDKICIELEPTKEDSQESDNQDSAPRRVITDTGDIVETISSGNDTIAIVENPTKDIALSSLEMEVVDKKGRVFTRRYVQIDKFTAENDTAKPVPKTPYHQVVIKEIVTMDGGEKMKVYNCIVCHIYVTELEEFKSHPCTTLKYTCPHCPVSYENAKSLCAHMKVHKITKPVPLPKPSKPEPDREPVNGLFKCEICSTEFQSNKSLKLHKRMHDPVKSRPIEPPVEDNNEPPRPQDNQGKFCCLVCNKWIPVGYRTIHNNFHKTKENFNCDICNKKFVSHNYLTMHMNVHNVEKVPVKKSDKSLPYNCVYCDRQFARPHEKVKHERIHTGEKPHVCDICGKSFRVSYCLTLHMRTHTGARPYACQFCGKRFKAHSVYNHHLLTHSDVRAYKCPYCPKAFKTSVQLAGHKNSHTKPFSCTQCNRPFASLYAVRVHTETHRRQNNLKFCCSMCGASYARSFALKDHMRQVHQKEMDDGFEDTKEISNEAESVII